MHQIRPTITSQSGKRRIGKGFSPDEIKEAGLNTMEARKMNIPIDRKRRTSHEDNVDDLKARMEKAPTKKSTSAKEKKSKN